MSYFDRKEEVIDLVITKHGRRLIADGKFKPEFYAFFDDDILYDIEYQSCGDVGGPTERPGYAELRIKDDTIRIKQQTSYSAIDIYQETEKVDGYPKQKTKDHFFTKFGALGNSEPNSPYAPAWRINVLRGRVDSMAQFYTGSNTDNDEIPQIDILLKYKGRVMNDKTKLQDPIDEQVSFRSPIFEDGFFIKVDGEQLFLEVEEKNVEFTNDNFTIEFFVDDMTDKDDGRIMRQMKMNGKSDDWDDVSYFLEVKTDSLISNELYCEVMPSHKKRSVFDKDIFQCADDIKLDVEETPYEKPSDKDDGSIC